MSNVSNPTTGTIYPVAASGAFTEASRVATPTTNRIAIATTQAGQQTYNTAGKTTQANTVTKTRTGA